MVRLAQNLTLPQMQSTWAAALNPILTNPIVNGRLIEGVELINGTTVINHGLGRNLRGWIIVSIDAAATVYDNQATNQMSQLTLSLTSSAAANCNLWVF